MEDEDAAVTVPSFPKAGFRLGIFSTGNGKGRFIARDHAFALAVGDLDRGDLGLEGAGLDGGNRAAHRLGGKSVLTRRA